MDFPQTLKHLGLRDYGKERNTVLECAKLTGKTMNRYLYTQSGSIVGYLDQQDKYLYTQSGTVVAHFDNNRKYMYTQEGAVYGYVGGQKREYLYKESGEVIGYFRPPLTEPTT